ncbi:phosphoserine aminotransferase-like isoform X2 [Gordionus sp. m RMFG-2023]|uniref:phosphoserine aminotransferase-like isoform X2 n=1 Tax=Gordionus sp. m RMFG-2023 TaxID=3053472 RepID=UPI0031FD97F2
MDPYKYDENDIDESNNLLNKNAKPEVKPACNQIRVELKDCLINTDCVKKFNLSPKDCLTNNHPSVPHLCYKLRTAFFECKRSILDNRTRFRDIINFSAGPSKIPNEVKQTMYKEFLDYQNTGSNIFELSHRSEYFVKIVKRAKESLKTIFDIPNNYEVLFMQGGATAQFSAIPLNLIKKDPNFGGTFVPPDYFITGQWSAKAAKEVKSLLGLNSVNLITPIDNAGLQQILTSTPPSYDNNKITVFNDKYNVDSLLERYLINRINPESPYFYYCSNETIEGFEINDQHTVRNATMDESGNFLDILERAYKRKSDLLNSQNLNKEDKGEGYSYKKPVIVCDMSSNLCTKKIDLTRFGLIYAGAQKNIGIAGITVVIIRKDLINSQSPYFPVPSVMNYAVVSKADSLPNTPPVYSIYALALTLEWILDQENKDFRCKHQNKIQNGHSVTNGNPDDCSCYEIMNEKENMSGVSHSKKGNLSIIKVKDSVKRGKCQSKKKKSQRPRNPIKKKCQTKKGFNQKGKSVNQKGNFPFNKETLYLVCWIMIEYTRTIYT